MTDGRKKGTQNVKKKKNRILVNHFLTFHLRILLEIKRLKKVISD